MQLSDLPPHLTHSRAYEIRTSEITNNKSLSVPGLIQLFMESAMLHAQRLNVSVWELEKTDLAWVLQRLRLEVTKYPQLGEQITILTRPSGNDRLFTYRDFLMRNESGEDLAKGSSSWITLSLSKRKRVPLPLFIDDMLLPTQQLNHHPRPIGKWKSGENQLSSLQFRVLFHHLDFNDHMSNIYYPEWIIEPLGSEWLHTHQLRSLDVVYKNECNYGDIIDSMVSRIDSATFSHSLVKLDGNEVLRAQSNWEKMNA